jgi:HK97 gp10 family phage protein
MARNVHIAGADELAALLKLLPKNIERNIMRSALRYGARVIANEAKKNITTEDTGALKRSIRTSSRSQRGTVFAYARAGGKRSGAKKDQAAFYAAFIEYGSAAHEIKAKKAPLLSFVARDGRRVLTKFIPDHPGIKARPFMRPAFDAKADAAVEAVAKRIRQRLSKEGLLSPAPEGSDDVG